MEKECKNCGKKFSNRASDYCSSECASNNVPLNTEKLLKEEKDKLLDETDKKVTRRNKLMNPEEKYDTDNELLK